MNDTTFPVRSVAGPADEQFRELATKGDKAGMLFRRMMQEWVSEERAAP